MVGAESGTAPAEETFAVYNGRYHGGWANVHSSSNATIAITSENIKVQIATADVGPLPDASPGRRLTWSDVKTFRIDRTLFGSEEVGRGVYSQINIGIATGSTVAFDVPNVEPLEIWRALDRVQAFRDRIPDRIAAQISASPILSSTRGSPSLAAPAVQSDSPRASIAPTAPPAGSRRLLRKRNVLPIGLLVAAAVIFEVVKHPGIAIVVGVLAFFLLVILSFAFKSISKSVQKIQGRARCVACKSRLKAVNGQYGTTCRKCGTVQPWARAF